MAIDQAQLAKDVLEVLEETFERHHGIYLDKGDSLLETLAGVDHRRASIPVGSGCASLAAQVAHVTFYLEVIERDLTGEEGEEGDKPDWGEIWRTVEAVSAEEWDALRSGLEATYRRLMDRLRSAGAWEIDPHLWAALPAAVHTAYHLGEIRQALCWLGRDG